MEEGKGGKKTQKISFVFDGAWRRNTWDRLS